MRKGRRERIEKGSREGIEKETKRQFEEGGADRTPPPLLEFLDLTLRCSHCSSSPQGGAQASKFVFYKLIECIIKKCHGMKQNAKKCAIGETECNEILSLYVRKTENLSEEQEGMGEREKRED